MLLELEGRIEGQRAKSDLAPSFRWKALKAQLIGEWTKLGYYADLKQFYRDLEDLEEWISEMLPTACDESYKDPTNIQASSKYEFGRTSACSDYQMNGHLIILKMFLLLRSLLQGLLSLMWRLQSHYHFGYERNINSSFKQKLPFLVSLNENVIKFLFLQRKYLKHQTFENEVNGRAEQVEGIINLGNSLIEQREFNGSGETIKVDVLLSMDFGLLSHMKIYFLPFYYFHVQGYEICSLVNSLFTDCCRRKEETVMCSTYCSYYTQFQYLELQQSFMLNI